MLGVSASMAKAPLIGLVGADGFGVHLFEQSSAGKTTTANIASSVWGVPDALRLTRYRTALGIANEAEAHNDGLLPLDEIGRGAMPATLLRLHIRCLTEPESCRGQRGWKPGVKTLAHCGDQYRGNGHRNVSFRWWTQGKGRAACAASEYPDGESNRIQRATQR